MKIKAVSGYTCHVKNLNKTVKFYETLGFENRKQEANHAVLYSNWFWIDFLAIGKDERTKDAKGVDLGTGISMYLSVEDVDEFHAYLLARGLKPKTKPQNQPRGNREFVLRDPDGYNLVIFKRK